MIGRWNSNVVTTLSAVSWLALELFMNSAVAEPLPEVVISVFQPPLGYEERLEELGEGQIRFTHRSEEWRSFFSAEVWIFFVPDKGEVSQLPDSVLQALNSVKGKDLAAQTNFHVIVNDERNVDMTIFNMSKYEEYSHQEMVCRTAGSVFSDITNEDQFSAMARMAICGID